MLRLRILLREIWWWRIDLWRSGWLAGWLAGVDDCGWKAVVD